MPVDYTRIFDPEALMLALGYEEGYDKPEKIRARAAALRGDPSRYENDQQYGLAGMMLRGPTAERISKTLYGQGTTGKKAYADELAAQTESGQQARQTALAATMANIKDKRSAEAKAADDARQERQWQADYGLRAAAERRQAAQAGADAYAAIADPISGEIVLYNKKTGERKDGQPLGPQIPSAAAAQPRRPGFDPALSGRVKMTEAQDKSLIYAQTMADALPGMASALQSGYVPNQRDLSAAGPPRAGIAGIIQQNTPRGLASDAGREFYTNGRQVLAAILRKESGAAITDDEWQNYGPMYLPWPGDTPQQQQEKLDRLYERADTFALGAGGASRYWQGPERPNWSGPRKMNAPGGQPAGGPGSSRDNPISLD